MLVPYRVDVPLYRHPIANFILIGVTVVISILFWTEALPGNVALSMVLKDWNPIGWFGSLFLHANTVHLVGNMLFLWVFGNAICAKLGNGKYILLYFLLGASAAIAHLLASDSWAIGASGAINGIVGAYLVLYPRNSISCMLLIIVRPVLFSLSSFWMILYWLAFDIWGAASGGGMVAYWAHLGGFFGGVTIMSSLLLSGVIKAERGEQTLLEILGIVKAGDEKRRGSTIARQEDRPKYRPLDSGTGRVDIEIGQPFRVPCSCGKTLRIPIKYAGKRVLCPACKSPLAVPEN